ncbi:MAG: hypothetical protein ACOZCO_10510 [Bacteroidota bacterium]
MKALSIFGIIISVCSIFGSFAILNMGCDSEFGHRYIGADTGIAMMIFSFYFLAFSIVATIVSFKKHQ